MVAEQLPVALELAPDLVSFHAGPNDVLRPRADLPALLARYDAAVGRAGRRGDPYGAVHGRRADRQPGGRRTGWRPGSTRSTLGVRATAERHGAVLVDLAAVPVLRDRRLWHEDRLHLAPEGHARVAAAVLEALGVERSDWWRSELPGSARASRAAALAADVRWVRVHLLPWIGRRIRGVSSGDRVTAKHAELVDIIPD